MKVYTTDKIRNVVLLGHGGSGKTSLVEAMAYLSGITSRMGKVSDKNTISDYDKEEQKRQFSINTSVVPIEWEGYKINIMDTPGYFDFVGEVEEAVVGPDDVVALRAEEHHGQGGVNHGVFGGGVHVAGVAVQIFVQLPAAAHRGLAAVQGQQEHQSQLHQGQLPAEGGGQQGE